MRNLEVYNKAGKVSNREIYKEEEMNDTAGRVWGEYQVRGRKSMARPDKTRVDS